MSRDPEERKRAVTRPDGEIEQQLPARPDPTAHTPLDLSKAELSERRRPHTAEAAPEYPDRNEEWGASATLAGERYGPPPKDREPMRENEVFSAATGLGRERLRPPPGEEEEEG